VLHHEPKWNDKILELNSLGRNKSTHQGPQPPPPAVNNTPTMSETPTHLMQADSKLPDMPECRDSDKRRSSKTCDETESSSAYVEITTTQKVIYSDSRLPSDAVYEPLQMTHY
jgi:hypothetical protein